MLSFSLPLLAQQTADKACTLTPHLYASLAILAVKLASKTLHRQAASHVQRENICHHLMLVKHAIVLVNNAQLAPAHRALLVKALDIYKTVILA